MKQKVVITAVVLLVISIVSIASALQITVDGDPADWDSAASVATSPSISTPLAGWDIKEAFFTNDQNNFYWRIDTYAPPQWNLPANQVILQICMNIDNDTSTGVNLNGSCNSSSAPNFGFDYMILVYSNGSSQPTIETYYCGTDCNSPASPAQIASVGTVTEIGVPISDLNLTSCVSGSDCPIPTTVYSTQFPLLVDWAPDPDQTFTVALPGPTAVSLNTFSAHAAPTQIAAWLALAVAGLLLIFLSIKQVRFLLHLKS